jgi:hypothetical protein
MWKLTHKEVCWVLMAHACNLSYSGGRDQEDCGLKPALGKYFARTYLEINITKKGWWSGSRCRLWVQTPVPPKKKESVFCVVPNALYECCPMCGCLGGANGLHT